MSTCKNCGVNGPASQPFCFPNYGDNTRHDFVQQAGAGAAVPAADTKMLCDSKFTEIEAALLQVHLPKNEKHGRLGDEGGTAFFITEDGYALTAKHVIKGQEFEGPIVVIYKGQSIQAEVVGVCPSADVAVLRVVKCGGVKFPYLQLDINIFPLRRGVAVGFQANTSTLMCTSGIVGYGTSTTRVIPFDGHASPGFSGGPVLDEVSNRAFGMVLSGNLPPNGVPSSVIVSFAFIHEWLLSFWEWRKQQPGGESSSPSATTMPSPPSSKFSAS